MSLRAAFADAQIHWLVQRGFEDAVSSHPAVTRTIPFDRKELATALKRGSLTPLRGFLRELRSAEYDLVIDAQGLARSGLIALATGAPLRVGHSDARELGWLGLNQRVTSEHIHTVDRMLHLLTAIDVPIKLDLQLYVDDRHDRFTAERLGQRSPIVLAPTSRWPAKRWPIDRWHELAQAVLHHTDETIVVLGGPGEKDQCRPLTDLAHAHNRVIDCVGSTSVGEAMAIIKRSRLVVANDSAALHMAVGFHRPTVALFGPTDITRVGPYGRDDDVIQHIEPDDVLDHKNDEAVALMQRITADEVITAALRRISRGSARTHA